MLQFEKYQQYAGGQLSGANYDLWGIGETVAGMFNFLGTMLSSQMQYQATVDTNDANRQIAAETNQANRDIAEETNKMNKKIADDANKLARDESEKAYQRSTQTNQIAELMRAGFSAQQAKQIVAGSGSPASYPAAPVQAATMQAATMQPATMQAPQFDVGAIGNSFGSLGQGLSHLGQDLTAPDGGVIGYAQSEPFFKDLSGHEDSLPDDFFTSPSTMRSVVNDQEWRQNNSWFDDKVEKHFNRALRTLQGRRALMNFGSQLFDQYNAHNQVKAQVLEYKSKLIDYHLQEMNASWQDANFEDMQNLNKSLLQYHVNLSAEEFQAKSAELQFIAEQAKLNLKSLQQDGYKEEFMKRFLSDQKLQNALNDAAIVNAEYEKLTGQAKVNFAKQFKSWIAAYHIFSECGLMKTNVGVGVATAAGATMFFVDKSKEVLDDDGTKKSPLQQAAEGTANGQVIWPNK